MFVPYRSINARKKALEAEKERSARVASLPLPPPNPIQVIFLTPFRVQGYQSHVQWAVCGHLLIKHFRTKFIFGLHLFCVITHIYLLEHWFQDATQNQKIWCECFCHHLLPHGWPDGGKRGRAKPGNAFHCVTVSLALVFAELSNVYVS